MYAEFTDDLVTGNEVIDSQHKELINKINDLLRSCENDSSKDDATKMLNYLSEYTNYHFGAEESLQESIGYPGIEEHKKKHAELKATVQELYDLLAKEKGPTDAFAAMVNEKVTEWLYYHIQSFDRSVAEYKYMRNNVNRI